MVGRTVQEDREEHGGAHEAGDVRGSVPAPRAALHYAQHEQADGDRRQRDGDRVEASFGFSPFDSRSNRPGDSDGRDERDVDEEDPSPPGPLHEHGAERRGDGGAEAGDAAPHADGHRPPADRELEQ